MSNSSAPTYVGGADITGTTNSGSGGLSSFPNHVHVSGRYAYAVKGGDATACSQSAGSAIGCELQVYDVSNPSAPAYVGGADASGSTNSGTGNNFFNRVFVSGGYAHVVLSGNTTVCSQSAGSAIGCELQVYDVSSPATPTYVGGADSTGSTNSGTGDTFFNLVYVSGGYAYVAKQGSATACSQTAGSAIGCELQVYDVSDPTAPTYVGGADATGSTNSGTGNSDINALYVSGRYALVAKAANATACSQSAGSAIGCELQVYDVTGVEATSVLAHSLEAGSLQVRDNAYINNQLAIGGGLDVGVGGIFSDGAVGIKGNAGNTLLTLQPSVALTEPALFLDLRAGSGAITNNASAIYTFFEQGAAGSAITNYGTYLNFTTLANDAGQQAYGQAVDFNNSSTTGTQTLLALSNNDTAENAITERGMWIINSESTANSITDYLLIETSSTDTTADAIDVSSSGLFNAINIGTNNLVAQDIRLLSTAASTWTFEDTSGNDLCTLTDDGDSTPGNFACTGNITGSSTGTVGYWTRTGTTLSPATANDIVTISTNAATGTALALTSSAMTTSGSSGFTNTVTISGTGAASTYYGSKLALTNNQTANADTLYGQYISFTDAGSLANTVTGLYVDATTANTADTTYAAIFQGGNVGIGDITPDFPLEILSTTNPQFAISNADGTQDVRLGVDTSGNLTINTVGTAGYVRIGDTATPSVANGDDDLFIEGDLEIGGTCTGCGAGGNPPLNTITAATVSDIDNDSLNFAILWDWSTLTTQTAMTFSGGTAMTTGSVFGLTTQTYTHTAAEVGEVMNLDWTDTSSNASGVATTYGLLISPTVNVTAGAGEKQDFALGISPTFTQCTTGTCTVNGLRINDVTDTANLTSTTLSLGSGWDTDIAFADSSVILDGPASSSLTLQDFTTFNCTDCIDFDDLEDTLDLDASTTINADDNVSQFTLTLNSDLSIAGRTTEDVLKITQPNDATNDSTGTLLKLEQLDTASSTSKVIAIDQRGNTGNAYGIWFDFSNNGVYTAVGTTGAPKITSGNFISAGGGTLSPTDFSGNYILVNPTRTYQGSGTLTDSGNFLELTRTNVQNTGTGTFAITGDLATFTSTCSESGGSCTDSSDVLQLTQSFGEATGSILNLVPPATTISGGTLEAINIGAITTSGGTDIAINIGSGWDTDIAFADSSVILDGPASSSLTLQDFTTFNCTDCIDFDDLEDTLDLDASTTINADDNVSQFTLTLNSDLSVAARSAAVLSITQANSGSFDFDNPDTGLLTIANNDTGSGVPLLYMTQDGTVGDSYGIYLNIGSASAASISSGFRINSVIDSGRAIYASNNASGTTLSDFTGDIFLGQLAQTLSGADTVTASGNLLDITRSYTTSNASATVNITGDLVNFSSTCTQTSGTCTDSSDVLQLTQSYGSATGSILNITPPATTISGGTLEAINIDAITTSGGTDIAIKIGSGWDTAISLQNAETINNTSNGIVTVDANTGTLTFDVNGEIQLNLNNATSSNAAVCATAGTQDPTNTVLDDCTTSVNPDYAEVYPAETEVDYGDVVATGPNTITADHQEVAQSGQIVSGGTFNIPKVTKSTTPYQQNVLGVASNNWSDFSSTGGNSIPQNENPKPVALVGRVPVKISVISDPINVGDYLTTSSEAGRAMKATAPGQMIGKALEPWDPASGKDKILVFVSTSYADPSVLQGGTLQEATESATLTDRVSALETDVALLESQLALMTSSSSQTTTTELTTNKLTVNETLTSLGSTILADTIVNGKLNIGTIQIDNTNNSIDALGTLSLQPLALGNIEFMGGLITFETNGSITAREVTAQKYNVNSDSVGTGTILAGETTVFVPSSKVTQNSLVFTNPKTPLFFPLAVTLKQEGLGFTVELYQAEANNVEFDWWIVDKLSSN